MEDRCSEEGTHPEDGPSWMGGILSLEEIPIVRVSKNYFPIQEEVETHTRMAYRGRTEPPHVRRHLSGVRRGLLHN